MGNIFSLSVSADSTISRCWDCTARRADLVFELEENLAGLRDAQEDLNELRNDIRRRVVISETREMMPFDQVEGWLSRVVLLNSEADDLLRLHGSTALPTKCCLGGYYPNNCKARYKLGKRVTKKLNEVAVLKSRGLGFGEVAGPIPPYLGDKRPEEPTMGLESRFDKVWNHLIRDDQVGIIGLFGMGGVGKTTLLNRINNELLSIPNEFNFVIWVVISRDLNLHKVQDKIGKRIGLFANEKWMQKSLDEKASDIFRVLSKKRFVLLLDDLWERVDLHKIGVPNPRSQKGSKLVFTTRSEEVCSHMEAQKKVKVDCLVWEDAWKLFEQVVGQEALSIHPDIPSLAEIVAKECGGLPLALITIGRAMACKRTPEEWLHAIDVLKKSASEFSGMGDGVFPLLKFSYDNLPNDAVKSCFVYCTLFPEDTHISKNELINFWIGEKFLDDSNGLKAARYKGYDIIGTLLYACLLEEEGESVKLHDVIRDMALWIANECGEKKNNFLVQTGSQLIKAPEAGKWVGVKRMSLMGNYIRKLSEGPECMDLSTLFLNNNHLKIICDEFFEYMPALRVLDLKNNDGLVRLPTSIAKLSLLTYLDISSTGVNQLPLEMGSMVKLKYLNLEDTRNLDVIPPTVISNFVMLQVLRLRGCGSFNALSRRNNSLPLPTEIFLEELKHLKQLNCLSITIGNEDCLLKFISSHEFLSCIQDLTFQYFRGPNIVDISSLESMTWLNKLEIIGCAYLKGLVVDWSWKGKVEQASGTIQDSSLNASGRCFYSLRHVCIENCADVNELTVLIHAPNLAKLEISSCNRMQEVIQSSHHVSDVVGNRKVFSKLEVFVLTDLPSLKRIYEHTLLFPYLKKIHVRDCPELKKLPLGANSLCSGKMIIEGGEVWWYSLQWEDETTKVAFSPSFRSLD